MAVVNQKLAERKSRTAAAIRATAKSFFEFHDKPLKFKPQERIRKVAQKVDVEIIPSKEQIHAMIAACVGRSQRTLRNRAIIQCLFKSGVRVNSLLNWKIGSVRDQLYPQVRAPVRLKITRLMDTKLSSQGLSYYYTFLDGDAGEALKAYLDSRIVEEGTLRDDDYIFKPVMATTSSPRTNKTRILRLVKQLAKKAGLDPKGVWTHCIRKSFRKVLNASNIDEDTKEALMGHKLPGSRENYFDKHDIDEVARKYASLNFNPQSEMNPEEIRKQAVLDFAILQGVPQEQISVLQKMRLDGRSIEEMRNSLIAFNRPQLPSPLDSSEKKSRERRRPARTGRNGGTPLPMFETRIVDEGQLVPLLNSGFDVVRELSNGRIVVRRPLNDEAVSVEA